MTIHTDIQPLSTALQLSTAAAHERAEHAGFMSALLEGRSSAHDLVALLTQLLPIYQALENSCRTAGADPRLAPLLDPALDRTNALAEDLAFHRSQGMECTTVLPAARAYSAELERAATDPAALVGHHYVRYLGDLSGGQIIDRMVRRHYSLSEGLSFYHFDIDKPKPYKDAYRASLDALPLTAAEHESALNAAILAFEFNTDLFTELADLTSTPSGT